MATKTISAAGGKWSESAAWSPEGKPTSADDVRANGSSGSLELDETTMNCRSFDMTGYTKTITHKAACQLTIGHSTAPPENKGLVFPAAGWTYTLGNGNTSKILFGHSVVGLTVTADYNGKVSGQFDVNCSGAGSGVQLVSNYAGTAANVNLSKGVIDLNGQSVTCSSLSSNNSNVREFKFGSSTVTVTGTALSWNMETTTNLTIAANTAQINLTGTAVNIRPGGVNFNGASLAITGTGLVTITLAGFTGVKQFKRSNAAAISTQFASTFSYVAEEWLLSGASASLMNTISASTNGSAAVIKQTSGTSVQDFVSLKDSKAEGGATFYAGWHSENVSGNSGWLFEGLKNSGYGKVVLEDSPLAFWPMTDSSGNAAEASGGTAITETGVLYRQPGPMLHGPGVMSYDGINDSGQVALNLSAQSKITVEFWLKWDVNGSADDFALEHSATANSNNGFNFDWDNSTGGAEANTVSVKWRDSSGQNRRSTFPRPTAAAWHHVVAVLGMNSALKVYVDGVEQAVTARETTEQSGNFASTTLNVMSRNNTSLFGAGDMGFLAFYSGELSKSRVEAHYAARTEEESTGGAVTVLFGAAPGSSGASVALAAPTQVVFGVATQQSAAAAALIAQTLLALGGSPGGSDASFALTTDAALTLSASSNTGAAALTLTAPTAVPLSGSAAVILPSLSLSTPTTVPLGASATATTAAALMTARTLVTLSGSPAATAAALLLTAPPSLTLQASAVSSASALNVTSPTVIALSASPVASTSAALVLSAPTRVALQASPASAQALLQLTGPVTVLLDPASPASSAALAVTVPALLMLGPSTVVAGTALVLHTGEVFLAPYTPLPTGGRPDESISGGYPIDPVRLGGRPIESTVGGYPVLAVRLGGYPDDGVTFGFPIEVRTEGDPDDDPRSGEPRESRRDGRPREARTGGRSDSET